MNTLAYRPAATLSGDDFKRRRKLAPAGRHRRRSCRGVLSGYSGMLRTVTHAILPQVVNVTFVAAPEPLKAPPPPKTVPLVQPKQSFVPPLPQVNIVQTEPTITLPPPQPRPSEPAPAVAAPVAQAAPPAPPQPAAPKTYRAWNMCACRSRSTQASRAAWARPA
jgi:protein TonB